MENITSEKQLSGLLLHALRLRPVTNGRAFAAGYRGALERGALSAAQLSCGLALAEQREGFMRLHFWFAKGEEEKAAAELSAGLCPGTYVCEAAYRPADEAMQAALDALQSSGFSPVLQRVRMQAYKEQLLGRRAALSPSESQPAPKPREDAIPEPQPVLLQGAADLSRKLPPEGSCAVQPNAVGIPSADLQAPAHSAPKHQADVTNLSPAPQADQAHPAAIRQAGPAMAAAICRLFASCYDPLTGCLPTEEELAADCRNGLVQVLLRNGRIAAALHLARTKNILEIRHIAVDPAYRGQGLASALLCSMAEKEDFEKCILWTSPENRAAVALYEKTGFQTQDYFSKVLFLQI